MDSVRPAVHGLGQLPWLGQAGLLAFGIGAVGDLAYHALPASQAAALDVVLGAHGAYVHVVVLLGMALMLAGVAQFGLHRRL